MILSKSSDRYKRCPTRRSGLPGLEDIIVNTFLRYIGIELARRLTVRLCWWFLQKFDPEKMAEIERTRHYKNGYKKLLEDCIIRHPYIVSEKDIVGLKLDLRRKV